MVLNRKVVLTLFAVLTTIILSACAGVYDEGKRADSSFKKAIDVSPKKAIDVSPSGENSCISFAGDYLLTDPDLVYGVLQNGMRYVLLHNTTPEDRVSMHLDVQAGSMHEREDQRGIAHYLEHMLFNGSTHFKPGELIEYFQSIGMMFGADANAHTGFFETVYDILLPTGEKESLEKGLLVLQDYAEGALLLESEVEREKGVILAEKRERDSVSFRTFEASLNFELPDSRITARMPIGDEKVIEGTDRLLLKSYYDAWYRPEMMVLVMVGDFDVDTAKVLIEEKFSSIKSRATCPELPENTWIPHSGDKAFYHYEPEAGSTSVSIGTATRVPFEMETEESLKSQVIKRLADMVVQNRLSRDVRLKDNPFSDAGTYSGTFLRNVRFSSISAETSPENWQKTLYHIEQSLRQALTFGFTEYELQRVKADFILGLETAVKEASTRKSTPLARELINSINSSRFFMSPLQEMNLLKPVIKKLTLAQLNRSFKETWAAKHRLIQVTGNAKITPDESEDKDKALAPDARYFSAADSDHNLSESWEQETPEAIILAAYHDSQTSEVVAPAENDTPLFPYLPQPVSEIGQDSYDKLVLSDITLDETGIRIIEFKNGVRLNLKKTDFKKGEFIFEVNFGLGKLSEPEDKPGLAMVARAVINESGVGELTQDELDTALAGKNVTMVFSVDEDTFHFSGSASPEETELFFQLLYTRMVDPGFRQESLDLFKDRYAQMYQELPRTPDGMMRYKGERFLAGGDIKFGMPTLEQVESIELEDVMTWVDAAFEKGAVEISVVGDFEPQDLTDAAYMWFAQLPKRDEPVFVKPEKTPSFPKGEKVDLLLESRLDKALVVMAFPTDDFWDIHQTRRLNILAKIFSERLRKTLREEMGATYSPYAYNLGSRAYDGYGVLRGVVAVSPEMVDDVVKHMENIADELSRDKITQKELELVLEPIWTYIKDMVKTNGYWLDSVLSGSGTHPEKLKWAKNIVDDYHSISVDDISEVAKKFLKKQNSAIIVIKP
ncbi:Peptidase M16 family protein [Desulfamplus magnetovallimortis]|uniref:Peptidase M16 family protein n=1 Tax=Desulfamplus magnetovallimortis TaxID=1246637 RepID=A0A1W1H6Z7_9BACT|nr:M16 family metallopeptidase [Desulfamplus magnetovallimortis]SLM28252.1 Peptidase M16 family protein [Desulfamplus magnetovallimortis]